VLMLRFSGVPADTLVFGMNIGASSPTDPVGPDAYGYMAYDNTDTTYAEAPTYGWIELDPAYGGTGTEVVLGDYGWQNDKAMGIDLPFNFRYYGEDFEHVTVCSNGWLAFGTTILTSYFNWTIPGAGGPDAMLAAFWDDLYQGTGSRVFQRYDAANHSWAVEWSRMLNRISESTETFEIQLLDPAWHPTATGDGLIVYQYHDIANDDWQNGRSTVGIESPDQMDGLLYTYWGDYASGAQALGAGLAIRFVPTVREAVGTGVATGPVDSAGASIRTGLGLPGPNPFTSATRLSYRLAGPGRVKLAICDVSGRLVRTLEDGERTAGVHELGWDGSNGEGARVSPGVYYVRFEAAGKVETRAVTLIR
jgi:hypothetical protein